MYVQRLHVRNLKLLRDFEMSFGTKEEPRMWTVLLGENGRCKTSVLRAIAMAASGASRTHELADLPSLPDRRVEADMSIEADFVWPQHPGREFPAMGQSETPPLGLRSHLTMPKGLTSMVGRSSYLSADGALPAGTEDVLFEIRGRNLPLWFVAGYGTNRTLPRGRVLERVSNPTVERMSTLFDRGALIGTGFADLLENPNDFSRAVREVLIDREVLPDAAGVELRGRGGVKSSADLTEGHRFVMRAGNGEIKVPATWLSQGYQSTIAWLSDLLGHVYLESNGSVPLEEIMGLVLIDELDLHLHPRWQATLVTRLREALPRVQFVVTTHSPMLLPALKQDEIVILDEDEGGNVVPNDASVSPMLLTGSEIYKNFFGVEDLYPTDLARDLQRYSFLVGNAARSPAEDAEMREIQGRLSRLGVDPGWEPVPTGQP